MDASMATQGSFSGSGIGDPERFRCRGQKPVAGEDAHRDRVDSSRSYIGCRHIHILRAHEVAP